MNLELCGVDFSDAGVVSVSAGCDALLGDCIFMWIAAMQSSLPMAFYASDEHAIKHMTAGLLGAGHMLTRKEPSKMLYFNKDITKVWRADYPNMSIMLACAKLFKVNAFEPLCLKQHMPSADGKIYVCAQSPRSEKSLSETHIETLVDWAGGMGNVYWHYVDGNIAPPFYKMVERMKRCRFCVSLDSAPLWIAAALGVPCIGLFTMYPYECFLGGWDHTITPVNVAPSASPFIFMKQLDAALASLSKLTGREFFV